MAVTDLLSFSVGDPSENDLHFLAVIRASPDREIVAICGTYFDAWPTEILWGFVGVVWPWRLAKSCTYFDPRSLALSDNAGRIGWPT